MRLRRQINPTGLQTMSRSMFPLFPLNGRIICLGIFYPSKSRLLQYLKIDFLTFRRDRWEESKSDSVSQASPKPNFVPFPFSAPKNQRNPNPVDLHPTQPATIPLTPSQDPAYKAKAPTITINPRPTPLRTCFLIAPDRCMTSTRLPFFLPLPLALCSLPFCCWLLASAVEFATAVELLALTLAVEFETTVPFKLLTLLLPLFERFRLSCPLAKSCSRPKTCQDKGVRNRRG